MTIDRAGFPFIAVSLVPSAIYFAAGRPIIGLALSSLGVVIALFFRDPDRVVPLIPDVVVSPADGRVLYVGQAETSTAPLGDWFQISIFLSPLDVHVNRVPIAGRVTRVEHVPGSFLPAYREGAATKNERTEIWVQHDDAVVVFRQVVGALARRVVCRVNPGAEVQTGQRFGIMKFGSRMDVFLPTTATLLVNVSDRVVGGETVIARLVTAIPDDR
jgi:phosphatidylserine decarboxylase